MTHLDELCKATGTRPDEWEFLNSPDGGCGVNYWLKHKPTGKEAYIADPPYFGGSTPLCSRE